MRIAGLARRESGWIILLFFFSRGARGRVEILLEGRVVVGKCSSVFPTGSKNFTESEIIINCQAGLVESWQIRKELSK